MIYTSVADIYKAIDEPRERIYKRAESLNEEQANARPDANAWSATEIVEHLTIMEDRLVRMMRVMLTKAEGASAKSDRATVEINLSRSTNWSYAAGMKSTSRRKPRVRAELSGSQTCWRACVNRGSSCADC